MEIDDFFGGGFCSLTGYEPMGWQRRLFYEFVSLTRYDALDIPTGLGKTSVIAIWLLALAWHTRSGDAYLPRRLVYVVNRRTVVDQATDMAENLRKKLREAKEGLAQEISEILNRLCLDPGDKASPLAVSALRGELADNREWQADPSRPAIIIGTVDMIGSRLLFSGYGVSPKMRPFHAGLLGQDTLLVHDEAHLSPAFNDLVREIAHLQRERQEPHPLQILELSATQRERSGDRAVFSLTDKDKTEDEVQRRLKSVKILHLVDPPKDETEGVSKLVKHAFAYDEARKRILVYVRSPAIAKRVAIELEKEAGKHRIAILTGTIRGHERDQMASSSIPIESIEDKTARRRAEIFRGFYAQPNRVAPPQTEYLISTSAGEVGVDLDADHMVCDLATLDSMIQRLGRVNRLGRGEAIVHVIELPLKPPKGEDGKTTDARLAATKRALQSLPPCEGGYDASPQALRDLIERLSKNAADEQGETSLQKCFSKKPQIAPLTDILLDAWSLTRLVDSPGRPPVARWLHGLTSDPPSIYVAWRQEVEDIVSADNPETTLKTLFDKHPILARERLRGNHDDVIDELKRIARRLDDRKVVLLTACGSGEADTLANLVAKENQDRLYEATIILPPYAGGLNEQGMIEGTKTDPVLDVADLSPTTAQQRSEKDGRSQGPERMRLIIAWNDDKEEWSARELGGTDPWDLNEEFRKADHLRAAVSELRKHKNMTAMREKARIVLNRDHEGRETKALLLLARRGSMEAADESQDATDGPVFLEQHNQDVRKLAYCLVQKLKLEPEDKLIGEAIVLAAERHDNGKHRLAWQKAIGNRDLSRPLAKSCQRGFDDSICCGYRHEFGSLREAASDPKITKHPECDLILHLIAAHHGWARPHFERKQWDIADGVTEEENAKEAAEAMRRFARLQRRFGHWGLAWLEALLRAADYAVSGGLSSAVDTEELDPA